MKKHWVCLHKLLAEDSPGLLSTFFLLIFSLCAACSLGADMKRKGQ